MTDNNMTVQWLKQVPDAEHNTKIWTIYTLKAFVLGQHVLGVLPVGFGKSWIYHLEPLKYRKRWIATGQLFLSLALKVWDRTDRDRMDVLSLYLVIPRHCCWKIFWTRVYIKRHKEAHKDELMMSFYINYLNHVNGFHFIKSKQNEM